MEDNPFYYKPKGEQSVKIILTSLLFLSAPLSLCAATSYPGENFSLQQLDVFAPGTPLEQIQGQRGNGTPFAQELLRFNISHQGYRFPLFLQVREGRSVGFWAALPSYFLHDKFHRKLIQQYGRQNRYLKKENSAVYVWERTENLTVIYSGQCTITCFAHYLAVFDPKVSSLRDSFSSFNQPRLQPKRRIHENPRPSRPVPTGDPAAAVRPNSQDRDTNQTQI